MWKEYSGMQCRRDAVSFAVNRDDVASLTIPADLLRRIGVSVPGRAQLLIGEGEDVGRLKVEPVTPDKAGLALTRQGVSSGRWTMQFKAHLLPFPTQPHRATEVPAVVGVNALIVTVDTTVPDKVLPTPAERPKAPPATRKDGSALPTPRHSPPCEECTAESDFECKLCEKFFCKAHWKGHLRAYGTGTPHLNKK